MTAAKAKAAGGKKNRAPKKTVTPTTDKGLPKQPVAPSPGDTRRVLPTGELTEHACPTCHDAGTVDRAESGLAQPQPCPECKSA